MADTAKATATATVDGTTHKTRPEKPDEAKYKADLAKSEKEHAVAQEKENAIKAKIDLALSNDKDSPAAEKRNQLKAELESIKQQQSAHKSSRGDVQGKIASLDAQLKSRIAEQKNARSRVSWKNVDEIDREIARLEKQVDSGTMKLVDEKKALAEISSLRKQKKGFAGFEDAQKGIDELKSQIADLKKGMDNPEAKALGERYGAVQKELNDLRAEQDDAYKNVKSLRAERNKLHAEQQEKWLALREVKDKYFTGKKAYKQYEDEVYKQRRERQKAERDAFDKEKRRKVAEKKLEEASAPAYLDEILTAESLIRYFDPSANASNTAAGPGKFAAQAQRTVDSSNIKGTRVAKKEEQEDNYFVGSGGKKGKKGKKGGATEEASKFSMNLGVMEELAKVDVTPPSTQADVPGVIEKLKEKLAKWKADQDKQTKANVEKAQKEIDKLEKEAQETPAKADRSHDTAKKPALAHAGLNGDASADAEHTQEKDAVADAAEELKQASIEDKEE